ncbi:MAG TPA: type II toxin-antitoxin system HicB family antitoxin [Anaerolineae bacterium]|nr:type II toxin-antitoxin system HicB family antitoxin [Anaerolineae bacterium]MCB0224037.1 type II toxin-antitoxin system HicB family antitoxin [Anaerolineae bacterium]MCB9104396.1 type II toxin-antitoxin system HicB family antitoxin [Anaerolineales bacterium]HRV94413.1 type II toxin-antitoxin system HicB family antitoxin [Anaerolineae bacterium]
MAEYLVYIETKGDPVSEKGPVAHIPALPGAAARGKTIAEAKENIRQAVEAYCRLLREAGEPTPRVGAGIRLEFQETDATTFHTDFSAIGVDEMDMLLRWMSLSRQELVDLVKDLPEETLEWQPEDGSRSIHAMLYDIAEADLWFTDRLRQWPEAALYRLAAARGVALERLRALNESDWSRITLYDGEKWTPRKVIRRMLEYEREHIQQIKAVLAAKEG